MDGQAQLWLILLHRSFLAQNCQQIKIRLFLSFPQLLLQPKLAMPTCCKEVRGSRTTWYESKVGSSLCWLRNREYWVWAPIRNWSKVTEFSCSGKAQVHLANSRHIHFQLWWTDFPHRSTQISLCLTSPCIVLHVQGFKRVRPTASPVGVV